MTDETVETELRRKVEARVRELGYRSLHRMCFERHVEYQSVLRVMKLGLTGRTSYQTVLALERLELLDLFRPVKASA